jgi:phospholipase C
MERTGFLASLLLALGATLTACGSSSSSNESSAADGGGSDSGITSPEHDASENHDAASEAASGDGDGHTCPSPVAPDPLASKRAQCTFTTGAKVVDTLGIPETTRAAIPIKHVIVMMKENRSFDHLLGRLHDEGKPEVEPIPSTFSNNDSSGAKVTPFHQTTTCLSSDPDHQWQAMHTQVDDGKMDGFVTSAASSTSTDGHFVMGYYEKTDLPLYYWLASTFALNDQHFASVRSGTFPNRNFLLLGTADGVMSTGAGYPNPSTPTIFDALDAAGVTWGVYSDGSLLSGTLNWDMTHRGTGTFETFLQKLDDGSLPQVTFVDGIDNVQDDHPTANLQVGEAWVHDIYTHAVASKLWPGLAIIWTYDEAGGFADHVPPPNRACIARPVPQDQTFFELGVRVPLAVISPWARAGYTSHVVQDHTAITRFIATVFDLPALTARDANSDALLDLFDFECPPAFATAPMPPAPGTGGCDGSVVLTVSQPSYKQGTPIVVSFSGAPGNNPKDWIAVYPYPASGPTPPQPGSTLYQYVGGSHTPSTAPASGSVTLDMSALGKGPWPLPVGGYIAYYLLNDGYTAAASIDFTVTQ